MRNWHRRLGIATALLVVWLAFTGILLSHTEDLGLDGRHVGAGWLLDWYGVHAPHVGAGYRVGDAWVIQVGERIYFNDRPLDRAYGGLLGAVALPNEIVLAAGEQLLVMTQAGVLIEALGRAQGVPPGIRRIGIQGERLVLRTGQGAFTAEEDFLRWRRVEVANAEWARASALPPPLSERIAEHYRRGVLTVERVMLDLHSGRVLGPAGLILMDLVALAFVALAASGLWLWVRRSSP